MNNPTYELKQIKLWLFAGYLLVAFIFYLSLTPKPPTFNTSIDFIDKIGHFSAYFILMFWFAQIYFTNRQRLTCVVLFLIMGSAIEVVQSFQVTRSFEFMDMVANTTGVAAGYLLTLGSARFILTTLEKKYYRK